MIPTAEPDLTLIAKIFPVVLQFVFALLGTTGRVMRHVLRGQIEKCPHLVEKLEDYSMNHQTAAQLSWLRRYLKMMPCLGRFSTEATRFQSTLGLTLTLFTSIWLTQSRFFIVIASVALMSIIVIYGIILDSELKPSLDEGGKLFAFGCMVIGVLFVYASTIG